MKLSCGIVPVRMCGKSWEFLLLRCYKNWDFPKGMIDPGETPIQAALREFREETSLTEINIPSQTMYIETLPYSNGKIARYYLGLVTSQHEVQLTPNPVTGIIEHQEYRWMSSREAEKLLVPRLQSVLHWAEMKLFSIQA